MAKLPCLTSAPMGQVKGFGWRFRNENACVNSLCQSSRLAHCFPYREPLLWLARGPRRPPRHVPQTEPRPSRPVGSNGISAKEWRHLVEGGQQIDQWTMSGSCSCPRVEDSLQKVHETVRAADILWF